MSRLDRVKDGKRGYIAYRVSAEDLKAIEMAILEALCMKHLTEASQ